ncbi:bile acid:sodium symporter family protein [Panacagrimonas sp.]|uniref:bile acid:sodium symporter family protein n=1 Tax=Panacagrimonas sp. TaxID=2480088 RepID=UPI003B526AE6
MSALNSLLPIALAIIMLGLGLSLTAADFRRVLEQPRSVVVALVCQVLLLPAVCFGLAIGFGLIPELAVGLMLLAASPGGSIANIFSHLSNGDVALNITLTAVNSLLSLLTLPIVVNLSLAYFMGEGRDVPLQPAKILQVFALVLIPVIVGMVVRRHWPAVAARMDRPVRLLSVLVLALMFALVFVSAREALTTHLTTVGVVVLIFNVLSLVVGYTISRVAKLGKPQAIAIAFEVGIHNAALAITIALSPFLLANPTMAIPPMIYGLTMVVTAVGFGLLVNRTSRPA